MPIILAIEPDRRQRDALAAVVRQRVGAELILADTTERALEAIGNRVPDLVLVPALLSPSDDAALAAALRVIAAAAHVRTLTIPVLAAHSAEAAPTGILSRWRRGRAASQAPDGCDPALFAEQIVAYLKESAAERALLAADEDEDRRYRRESDDTRQSDAPTHARSDAPADVPADMQTFLDADLPAYAQPEAPVAYAQPDAHVDAQPETPAYSFTYAESTDVETSNAATYARADTQPEQPAYTPAATQPEEPIYTPAYEQSYVQTATPAFVEPDVPVYADAQPEVPVYEEAQADAPVYAEVQPYVPVYTDAQADASSDEQPDHPWYYAKQADAVVGRQDEVVDLASGAEYDETPTGDESVSTLELEQEEDIDLSQELAELETEEPADTSDEELFDGEPVGVYTMPSAIDEPEIVVAAATLQGAPEATMDREFFADSTVDQEFFAESSVEPAFDEETLDEPMVVAEAIAAQAGDADAAAEWDDVDAGFAQPEPADAEFWMAASLTPRRAWPIIEGVPTESPIPASAPIEAAEATAPPRSARVPALTEPRPAPAPAPAVADPRSAPAPAPHKRDRPEWGELVASLRKDIERRRVDPPHEKPKPTATAPVPVQRRSKKAKPIQDEWGFFDPEQCGFAALLAKLDEITEGAEEPEVRQPS